MSPVHVYQEIVSNKKPKGKIIVSVIKKMEYDL